MPCIVQRREEGTALPEVVFVSVLQQIQIFGRKGAFGFELWLEYFKKHRELLIPLFFYTSVRLGWNSQ